MLDFEQAPGKRGDSCWHDRSYGPDSTICFVVLVFNLPPSFRSFASVVLSLSSPIPELYRRQTGNTHRPIMRIRSFTQGIPVPTFQMR